MLTTDEGLALMRLSRAVGGLLQACVGCDVTAPAPTQMAVEQPLDGLADAAAFHGIVGYAFHALHDAGWVADRERDRLRSYYHDQLHTHVRALADLAVVAESFTGEGLAWAVVKGPVLSEVLHERPDLRSYGDLDILVSGPTLRRAVGSLEQAGAVLLDRNWRLLREHAKGEVHLQLPNGTVADLHWSLINERSTREAFSVRTEDVLERARTVRIGSLLVPTSDPVDTLLHLGLHSVLSGGHRLVWFKDIERAVVAGGVEWVEVPRRARAWGTGLPTGIALETARRLLGFPLPDGIVAEIAPWRFWRLAVACSQMLAPVQQAAGGGSVTRIVARSTRAGGWSSVCELARRSTRWSTLRLGGRSHDDHVTAGGCAPGSLAFAAGSHRDLDAFYRTVAEASNAARPDADVRTARRW